MLIEIDNLAQDYLVLFSRRKLWIIKTINFDNDNGNCVNGLGDYGVIDFDDVKNGIKLFKGIKDYFVKKYNNLNQTIKYIHEPNMIQYQFIEINGKFKTILVFSLIPLLICNKIDKN